MTIRVVWNLCYDGTGSGGTNPHALVTSVNGTAHTMTATEICSWTELIHTPGTNVTAFQAAVARLSTTTAPAAATRL